MPILAKLRDEHRVLETDINRMLEIVANPAPDAASIAAIRWRLAQALFDHCAQEDRAIHDRLAQSGDATAIAACRDYRREHGAMGERFGRYIADWPIERISRDWETFGAETRAMARRVADRIAVEETSLYPLLERMVLMRAA
ncbi:hemerythrin domain-containing protein [Sphingomonas sp. HF-S3]|uniref:Hemerythrin domain-containing protein n=1 Tax=Sphingomonas rustica TaxID=3103142 RepID=A0ABV0B9A1_9SPHN